MTALVTLVFLIECGIEFLKLLYHPPPFFFFVISTFLSGDIPCAASYRVYTF